jgi:filamentous hemagglutinin family protein
MNAAFIGTVLVTCMPTLLCAQIVRDGTMGPAGAVSAAPDYMIAQSDGTTVGTNLFHSFSQFVINTGETATFLGSPGIVNVISLVTGGAVANIDGLLATSGMPGANFFLVSPAGAIFGPDSHIDVGGAFVVTTADELILGGGGLVSTVSPSANVLTTAAPSAFGFLNAKPNGITVDRSNNALQVQAGQSLSLIGGDIQIIDSTLRASGGRINLISVDAPGEAVLAPNSFVTAIDVSAFARLGSVELTDGSLLDVTPATGAAPGALVDIHAGQVKITGTAIATPQGGGLNIQGRGPITISKSNFNFGDIFLISNDSIIVDDSVLATNAATDGGNITFVAPKLVLIQSSDLTAQTGLFGGQIQLDSGRVIVGASNLIGLAGVETVFTFINPEALFIESDSQIDTGKQEMEPDLDIAAETLIFFPTLDLPDGRDYLLEICSMDVLDDLSSFIVTGRGGLPVLPGWWAPSLEPTNVLPVHQTPVPVRR